MTITLQQLAEAIGAELVGDGAVEVSSAGTLEEAGPGQISFLANPKYAAQLETTGAAAVIVAPVVARPRDPRNRNLALLKTKDPYYAFRQAVVRLHGFRQHPHAGVHPKAHVEPTATIGEGTVVYPGAYVGPRARIGRDCVLYPNATVYDDCVLGDRVTVHAGAVIGTDGFGFATKKDPDGVARHNKIPQIGNVVVEDDVEIGANAAIARGALGSTLIGRGTKIDNLVAIGHGARIGAHGMIVAQVGIAGSTTVGHHATLAGQVGVAGHLKIGDGVTIGAQSGVMADVPDQTTLIGSPAMPAMQARRVYTIFTQLPQLVERVRRLEGQIGELDADDADTA